VICGIYLKKTKNFKIASLFGLLFGTIFYILAYPGLFLCEKMNSIVIGIILMFIMGGLFYPVVPGYMELATENTFPVGEATSCG